MNKNITKIWTSITVNERELDWIRLLISMRSQCGKENRKNLDVLLEDLLNDREYQKLAISPMEDMLGNTIIRGTATVTVLLLSHQKIDKEILEELLYNLFFIYHSKEDKIPLALTYDISGTRYLSSILVNRGIELREEFKVKVAECISKLAKSIKEEDADFETDIKLITSFILRTDIEKSLKKKVIKEFTEEVATSVYDEINGHLHNNFGLNFVEFIDAKSELAEVFELLCEKV